MAESTGQDLVSKYVAIQYGLLVAGTVLLLLASWSWYQNWSSPERAACKKAEAACRAAIVPAVAVTTSTFAGAKHRSGKITENMLHEGFMDYSAEQTYNGVQAEVSAADEVANNYDPAQDSLDKSVFDSHKEFVDESYASSTGPSAANIERDDTNEVVKRVGLRRVDYTSVYSSDDARTVSSEYPEQVAQNTQATDDSGLF